MQEKKDYWRIADKIFTQILMSIKVSGQQQILPGPSSFLMAILASVIFALSSLSSLLGWWHPKHWIGSLLAMIIYWVFYLIKRGHDRNVESGD